MFRDMTVQLWAYELKLKCLLKVGSLIHHMATAQTRHGFCWALLIIAESFLRTFCMHPAHPLASDGWHLRGIMAFIIILSTLIDTLFDQRRYPRWIRVSTCQKCKMPLIRNASSVFIPFPLTLICSLSPFFASRLLIFSPSPWHIWITYHFPDCAPKKVKHSLPFFFSYWCASQQPACSGWNGSWSKTAANQGRKVEQDPFSARCTGWFDLVRAIASYEILDMHSNTSTFSDPVKPSYIFFDREYMHLKFVFKQTLKNRCLRCFDWFNHIFLFFLLCVCCEFEFLTHSFEVFVAIVAHKVCIFNNWKAIGYYYHGGVLSHISKRVKQELHNDMLLASYSDHIFLKIYQPANAMRVKLIYFSL